MKIFMFMGNIYVRYILIIFIALQAFFMSIDLLKYSDEIPTSINLLILFLAYDFLLALNYTFPISILLSVIALYINLLKTNQLGAILSLGYSRRQILYPILLISALLNLFYIGLNATPFVYAQEKIDAIIYSSRAGELKTDLLVKYKNNYIYIGKIYPILQKAENIKVFEANNLDLTTFIKAKDGFFNGVYWNLPEATITHIPLNEDIKKMMPAELKVQVAKNYKILKNFKPKVLDTIYQNKPNVSMGDALEALFLLRKQEGATLKIRAILYAFISIPLAMPLSTIIISFYIPQLARYSNLGALGFSLSLFALMVWGLFFMFSKLTISGFFYPEIGGLVPLCILGIIAGWYFKKL